MGIVPESRARCGEQTLHSLKCALLKTRRGGDKEPRSEDGARPSVCVSPSLRVS